MTDNHDLLRLEGKVDIILHRLDRVDRFLDGNGQPGARSRLAITETNLAQITTSLVQLTSRLIGFSDKVAALEKALATHTADKTQHGPLSILRRDVLLVLLGMTGLMALLVELGGGAIGWIKGVLGL